MDQHRKPRILKVLSWITGILALITAGLAVGWRLGGISMLKALSSVMFSHTPSECASIGIIGGADGPTAIYLSGGIPSTDVLLWLTSGILAAASILCALLSRKCAQRK